MKTIKVTIAPNGLPTIEAEGFQGGACKLATKPIEDALSDGKSNVVTDKPELFLSTGNDLGMGITA